MKTLTRFLVPCLLMNLPAGHALGQCLPHEVHKIVAADGAADDDFGVVTAVSGDLVLVGARTDDEGVDSGAAYVFRYNSGANRWVQEARLIPKDLAAGDDFVAVAIGGSVAVIGAWRDDDGGEDSGSAYVFRFDGTSWVEETKLTASDADAGDGFGVLVTTDGYRAAIAAGTDDEGGADAGAAYVFRFDGGGWVEEAKLLANDAAAEDYFGYPTMLSGDAVLVGAYGDDDNGSFSGSAYVFRLDGSNWAQEAKLTASDGETGDLFGLGGAIDGDVAAVSAIGDDDDAGSVYVFRFDPVLQLWNEEARLTASDAQAGAQFGGDVSVNGNVILAGAWRQDGVGEDSGAVYAFSYDGAAWSEVAKITASDAAKGNLLGNSVPSDGLTTVIGSRGDDSSATDAGAVYIVRELGDCNRNGVLDLCDIADGTSLDLNGDGTPDECQGLACPGDLNGDGSVDAADLAMLLGTWGQCR